MSTEREICTVKYRTEVFLICTIKYRTEASAGSKVPGRRHRGAGGGGLQTSPNQSRSQSPRPSVGGIVGLWEKTPKECTEFTAFHSYRIQYTREARNIRWSPYKELKMILLERITSLVLLRTHARVLKC